MRIFSLLFFLVLLSINSKGQRVLIEEFTNVGSANYDTSEYHLEHVVSDIAWGNYCIITYHTDFPADDPNSPNVIQDVINRMDDLGDISTLPSVVVDGNDRPAGSYYTGSTLNVNGNYLNTIRANKPNILNYFGLGFVYDDDFKGFNVSSGMSLFGTTTLNVRSYQVLVEEFIDDDSPVTPMGTVIPTNIFRGFVTYGEYWEIPGNGSTHGWRAGTIPDNVIDLNNLKVIVFTTDYDGNVLDCTSVRAPYVEKYKASFRNRTSAQQDFCQNTVVPGIAIKNEGAVDLVGFNVQAIINKDTINRQILETVTPNNEITYWFDDITLVPGDYDIKVRLLSIENAPTTIDIRETTTVATDIVSNYLVYDLYDAPDEGFETSQGCGLGNFYVRTQTEFAFKRVNGSDLGVAHPIGAYGNSDHCLMVDQLNWKHDPTTANNLTNNDDDPNFGFLYYNGFDLRNLKHPVLQFDHAVAYDYSSPMLKVETSTDSCSNSFTYLQEFNFNELNTADVDLSTLFIPDSTQWKTTEIPLFHLEDEPFLQLRFFVEHRDANAYYFDNIKVVSYDELCPDGNVQLTSQSQVDSFVLLMNNCNIINGDLIIGYCNNENLETDIIDLSGLSSLLEISGSLKICKNPLLETITGLHDLRIIGGDLEVTQNDQLISLADLAPDRNIGGHIRIIDNATLTAMVDFTKLNIFNGDLIVTGNPLNSNINFGNATEINGNCVITDMANAYRFFSELEYIAGDFILENNQNLRVSSSIRNLIAIDGHLIIKNSPRFASMNWADLEKIGGNFEISGIDSLETFTFSSLDSIGGNMVFENNTKLIDLSTFDALNYDYFNSSINNAEDLILINNPSLSSCNSALVCQLLNDVDRKVIIENNALGCHSVEAVSDICLNGVDHDGDGYGEFVDCDDDNDEIYPMAEEICDNLDNNCDGEIDEGFTLLTFYTDADLDGYGSNVDSVLACAQPPWTSTNNEDCNDSNSSISPSAIEIPNNGIDEDCDGMDLIISIYELANTTINIYPNPAINFVNIQITGQLDYSATIYDLTGRQLFSAYNRKIISVDSYLRGVYLLEIMDLNSGQKVVKKLIVGK